MRGRALDVSGTESLNTRERAVTGFSHSARRAAASLERRPGPRAGLACPGWHAACHRPRAVDSRCSHLLALVSGASWCAALRFPLGAGPGVGSPGHATPSFNARGKWLPGSHPRIRRARVWSPGPWRRRPLSVSWFIAIPVCVECASCGGDGHVLDEQ